VSASALYSAASVLEQETMACFLALHDSKLGPNNMTNPHVEPFHQGNMSIVHRQAAPMARWEQTSSPLDPKHAPHAHAPQLCARPP
jgi:hypothetical protein